MKQFKGFLEQAFLLFFAGVLISAFALMLYLLYSSVAQLLRGK